MARSLLLLLLLAISSVDTAFGSDADVNIFCAISRGPPLQLQCKKAASKAEVVLPWQTLAFLDKAGFGFTPNFWTTTKYICDFRWGNETQSCVVWYDNNWKFWLNRPCGHCLWVVKEGGFFRGEEGSDRAMDLVYLWND